MYVVQVNEYFLMELAVRPSMAAYTENVGEAVMFVTAEDAEYHANRYGGRVREVVVSLVED